LMLETATCSGCWRRFGYLRSLQWRIDLGILPSSPSASIDDLRRFTADSRRRYASLRKKLLIDPHFPKDGVKSGDLIMDDPLSQNPDSMWGQFFRNAELERMLDQDLSRLYPERGSYFQTSGCQGMLRRILLLWCVRNPEYGYRQGMHELLAPLLYVLQVDIERHLEVRKTYENHFADKFDDENHQLTFDFNKFSENGSEKDASLDPEIQTIVSLSDAYGAEGELGVVLSDKFMEHDAYSMFDALLSGSGGPISMAEFFSPIGGTGIPPVIEASRAVYHLLSVADPSLYGHLVGLEVEPQYFLLRWLRVLFGREFSLEDLLIIWDEIFSHENAVDSSMGSSFGILESRRGTFICAFAVSMMLFLRSSLLAAEFTTAPLQRLLNYPDEVDVRRLLKKANDLISRVAVSKKPAFLSPVAREEKPPDRRTSPGTPSYWEEKWRDLHGGEEESGDDKER
ncbi:microtubule-associated protein, partial [Genlisea aurea]